MMVLNKIYHGFKMVRTRKSDELKGTLYEFVHLKTGAQVTWLDNGEENRLFAISFRTVPSDNTGVFHIMEHSVLNGSEKYPVKEPFVEMLKGSMNTFLNAMTFTDKTVYPISSRNEKDFMNLTSVYLDGVFKPRVLTDPNIFYQEGWHYEVNQNGDDVIYNGVVYNEMKGSYSDIDNLMISGMNRLLYPNTSYSYESGGNPAYITDLTYEKFQEVYKNFYHPSNAKIYLDGNVPVEKVLKLMDEEYFNFIDKKIDIAKITRQEKSSCMEETSYYEASSKDDKCEMAMGKIMCDWFDREKVTAMYALNEYLVGNNESPLLNNLLTSGLVQDGTILVEEDIMQPCVMITARQINYKDKNKIKKIIKDTLEKIINEGIDKLRMESILNQMEFRVKNLSEPQGLIRAINALNTWNFDGDPMDGLIINDIIAKLKKAIDTDYFINLLKEYPVVNNEKTSTLCLLPSMTKGEEIILAEKEKINKEKNSWSKEDIARLIEENKELEEWQVTPDTPQNLATLPKLPISAISEEPNLMKTEVLLEEKTTLLFHKKNCNGITYIKLFFSLSELSLEEIIHMSFLTNLLGELPTKYYSLEELLQKQKNILGEIDYSIRVFSLKESLNECRPYFIVETSILDNKVDEAVTLIGEIINNTVFDTKEAEFYIEQILLQGVDNLKHSIISEGSKFALTRGLSKISASGVIKEKTEGYDFYKWLKQFAGSFDVEIDKLQKTIEKAQREIFDEKHLTISLTSNQVGKISKQIVEMFSKGNQVEVPKAMKLNLEKNPDVEGIAIPSGVSYTASCGSLFNYDTKFEGGMDVLSTLLAFNYLWSEVRVRGGAYGCGFKPVENGDVMFYSYRDPNPANTLQVYKKASDYIRKFIASDEPIDSLQIASAAAQEPLKNIDELAFIADKEYFEGFTFEDQIKRRKAILNITKKDLLKYCDFLDKMANDCAVCVVGSKEHLESCNIDNILEI